MVFVTVSSLIDKGQPWVGTRFRLASMRDTKMVAGPNKKPLRGANGQPIIELRAGADPQTVKFLGLSSDRKRIRYQDEDTGEEGDIPISGGGYYVERLSGGGRHTRKSKRKTYRKRTGSRKSKTH